MKTISLFKIKLRVSFVAIPAMIGMLSVLTEDVKAIPSASFTANPTAGCAPLSVLYTNTSTNAVSYYWDLGNGNTSTLPNPTILYTLSGSYTVMLIATDGSGLTDTAVYANYITVINKPVAGFNCPVTSACLDDNLFSFQNNTIGATTYLWDFGDGTTSTDISPSHHYNQSGTYTITLLATNAFGCQDVRIRNLYITVFPKPSAAITAATTSSCDANTVFNFSSSGAGIVSWNWTFGDGAISNQQNPSHSYSSPGTYPVSLIVTDFRGCSDTVNTPTSISVGISRWATFGVSRDSGCAPLWVDFYNTNANVASSFWNFGDGYTSTAFAPSHMFVSPGLYTVSLIVTTTSGCVDTVTKVNLMRVGVQPTANFTYSNGRGCAPFAVQFTNTSTNYATCLWNFGDGSTSSSPNPSHTYSASGIYSVTLTCYGPSGCASSRTMSNIINVSGGYPLYNASPRIGCPPLTVNFSNASYGNQLTYLWDFGDGTTSTLPTPAHVYSTSGNFNVTLTITDSMGCTSTLIKPSYVQTINPAASYVPPPTTVGCSPITAQFTDGTVGSSGWLWDFGDGTTSTLQNPVHHFLTPGIFTVTMTNQSAGGGCTQTISNFSTFDVRGGYAGFTHTETNCPPYQSVFTDTSLNAVSWYWDFGDGSTSTLQNPTHVYAIPGYYSASLTITTVDGCTYSTMQNNGVYFPPFGANFYGEPQDTVYPMPVNFHANSMGATGWLWNFGDSTTSTLENPVHVYPYYSNYLVTLMITNDRCTLFYAPPPFNFGVPDTTPIAVNTPGGTAVQQGCAPLSVSFSNVVEGAVQWFWDFGDGDTSSVRFPSHTYYNAGVYTVTLTTYDSLGLPSVLTMDSIVRVGGVRANFTFQESTSCNNTVIQLTDASIGNINSWFWSYGDGFSDTTQNAVHTYTSGLPNYIITHTVTDTAGCSSSISTSIFSNFVSPILVSESEICGLDSTHFSTSLQNYASYVWHFGDGDSSTLVNPVHVYASEGVFSPTLTVTDISGCSQTYSVFPSISVSIPIASFSSARHGCGSTRFDFVNLSSNADAYFWNFGDGATSTNQSPSHVYSLPGSYTVSLTIYRGNCVANLTIPDYITIDIPSVNFNAVYSGNCFPITATFTDLSVNAVSWYWRFGNGDTSTAQHPVYVYTVNPVNQVSLFITDVNGCSSIAYQTSIKAINANFTAQSDSGCVPFTANFTSDSAMISSWQWDFGDGNTSTLQSPSHIYSNPGSYDVTLIISSNQYQCSDTVTMPQLIKVKQPVAGFSSPDLYSCAPSVVNFTSFSQDADAHLWDFGDGTTSTNQHPSHIYNSPGVYSVSLIAMNTLGCSDTMLRQQYIRVLGPVTNFTASAFAGCHPFQVDFNDLSQDAVDWSWFFGDGYSSSVQNPTHVFQDTGSFTVSLITHDTSGCASFYQLPQPIMVYSIPVSSFTTNDTLGCEPYTVNFMNTSVSNNSSHWDFGDGTVSNAVNPSHTYTMPGSYTVQLVSANLFGCTDTFIFNRPIVILATPQPAFTSDSSQGCSNFVVNFQNVSSHLDQPVYFWDFGNGITSTVANPSVAFPNPGFYQVSLAITNANGCNSSVVFPAYVHVFDTLPPSVSEILSVSVASNTTVEIAWEVNPAIDLGAYKLFRLNPITNVFDTIFTVDDPNNTSFGVNPFYVDSGLNTLQQTYTYKLQTLDICGYTIDLSQLRAHTTINVSSQRAGRFIRVSWTPYDGCSVNQYQIFRSSPGTNSQWVASVPDTQLTYIDSTFDCPYAYSYRITATDLCGLPHQSLSDTSVTEPFNFLAGQVVDVIRSTVVEDQFTLTEWLPPIVYPEKVSHYDLYRSVDNQRFEYLNSVLSAQNSYLDYRVDVQNNHYFYRIKAVNVCNINEEPNMNTSTILLKGEMRDDRSVRLHWSPYIGWDQGVDYYNVEQLDENNQWQYFIQVDGQTFQYEFQK